MIVEIHGAGFQNKGAEMMLRSTIHELSKRIAHFSPALDAGYAIPNSFLSECDQILPVRGQIGLNGYAKRLWRQEFFTSQIGKFLLGRILGMPPSLCNFKTIDDIDALIDISGFAFSEQWGTKKTLDFLKLAQYYKRQGKPVILLPQAFGPFTNQLIREKIRAIIDVSTLTFVRDDQSYQYLKDANVPASKLIKSPDITISYARHPKFMNSDAISSFSQSKTAIFVPNFRMLDKGGSLWNTLYVSLLQQAAVEILKREFELKILVHDSSNDDISLSKRLSEAILTCQPDTSHADVIIEHDPVKLKHILGESFLVVGSRYHSLVSALSSNTPSIALGWSHKYSELFKDFACPEYSITHAQNAEHHLVNCIQELLDPKKNAEIRLKLLERRKNLSAENKYMWELVTEVLITTCTQRN